ncbi:MAG: MBL fold metallo-hydrolase [Clostridiales bacterium]|jgi:glyoxylase-like metal-dependent hydrolase (beta-lactamase superfamily II)|nr:MBL fold metallo-hydrolase [Clostridiales bacterium]
MELFQSENVLPGITRISSFADEFMYLIDGGGNSALVDADCGIGNVKEYVKKLTNKPLKVFLTHGHIDHATSAHIFDDVYLNPADDALYRLHCSQEFVDSIMPPFLGLENYSKIKDYIIPAGTADYKPLTDGMVFRLSSE